MIHLEITQSPKAGGWHMEEFYLWLADAVTLILSSPAVFRCVWFVPLFRTGQFWLPVHWMEIDSFRQTTTNAIWVSEQSLATKDANPSTHIFLNGACNIRAGTVKLLGISHASYFSSREAILFVSWYSTDITQLLKERDPWRMRKRDCGPDLTWCCPIFWFCESWEC